MALLLSVAAGGWLVATRPDPVADGDHLAQPETPVVRQRLRLAGPEELAQALGRAGLSPAIARAAAAAVGEADGELRVALAISPGRPAELIELEVRTEDGGGLMLTPAGDGGLSARVLATRLRREVKVVRGEMDATSFYASAVAAGVTDTMIPGFAAAFAFDFDFQREIRPGDVFEAAIERTLDGDGGAVGAERLVYVSLQTREKARALYRFHPDDEPREGWFDGNGLSAERSLMRTPVEGARLSSSFGPRTHPVLGYARMHKGADFAAPIGAPVYASGDGVVEFAGENGGYGLYLRIRHAGGVQTAYAHLSAFVPGLAQGSRVRQGQVVALSGDTGLSSGPHLHYEVLVNGRQVDPMGFQTVGGRALQGAALDAFRRERDRIDALRSKQNG